MVGVRPSSHQQTCPTYRPRRPHRVHVVSPRRVHVVSTVSTVSAIPGNFTLAMTSSLGFILQRCSRRSAPRRDVVVHGVHIQDVSCGALHLHDSKIGIPGNETPKGTRSTAPGWGVSLQSQFLFSNIAVRDQGSGPVRHQGSPAEVRDQFGTRATTKIESKRIEKKAKRIENRIESKNKHIPKGCNESNRTKKDTALAAEVRRRSCSPHLGRTPLFLKCIYTTS